MGKILFLQREITLQYFEGKDEQNKPYTRVELIDEESGNNLVLESTDLVNDTSGTDVERTDYIWDTVLKIQRNARRTMIRRGAQPSKVNEGRIG